MLRLSPQRPDMVGGCAGEGGGAGWGVMCFNVWQRMIQRRRPPPPRETQESGFVSIHSNGEHGKLRLLLSTNKTLNGRFRMITVMTRIHMIMNRMHYIAAAMIKHYPCDLTLIQSLSCIGSYRFAAGMLAIKTGIIHATRCSICQANPKSAHLAVLQKRIFPSLNALFLLNIIQRGPILSVFNLKVTERFNTLAISRWIIKRRIITSIVERYWLL